MSKAFGVSKSIALVMNYSLSAQLILDVMAKLVQEWKFRACKKAGKEEEIEDYKGGIRKSEKGINPKKILSIKKNYFKSGNIRKEAILSKREKERHDLNQRFSTGVHNGPRGSI